MPRKDLVTAVCAASSLLFAGCGTVREQTPVAARPADKVPADAIAPPKTPAPRPRIKTLSAAKPRPKQAVPTANTVTTQLPGLVQGSFRWTDPGRSFTATANDVRPEVPPVPLFRQAIVLADVRAALASSPARPKADFRHGALSIEFRGANDAQIADAVNRVFATGAIERVDATIVE